MHRETISILTAITHIKSAIRKKDLFRNNSPSCGERKEERGPS